jgi:hydroxyacylglutathione hydrolase
MYDSLQKIMTLPDDVLVYPAHGAGSSCGRNLGPETTSTIGEQKLSNYALQPQSREEFITSVTKDLDAPPQYFPINARINKEGYDSLDDILKKGLTPVSVQEFKKRMKEQDVSVLDTRRTGNFTKGFIPGSVSIGLEGRFAEWAGVILSFEKPILLVAEKGLEKEAVIRLARVGFSRIEGFLQGGFEAWRDAGEKIDMIIDVEADELAMDIPFDDNLVVIDVRRETEFGDGHITNAVNIPLVELTDPANMANFEDNHNIYIHCGTGYRSVIAASLLKKEGIHNIRNVVGGFEKIKELETIKIIKENSVLN